MATKSDTAPPETKQRKFRMTGFGQSDADPSETVYVDGAQPGYRSLTHWPGMSNSTPKGINHDLSTGIALNFARLDPKDQKQAVGDFTTVSNNHYDTDGALAAFTLVHPEDALKRADIMLAAAATGDFSLWKVCLMHRNLTRVD